MTLDWTIEETPEAIQVRLTGSITENADFHGLLDACEGKTLHIDLTQIAVINSCGVREWIRFVTKLQAEAYDVRFLYCSPAVVRQLNLIADFCGPFPVQSVLLPYFCDHCGTELETPLDIASGAHVSVAETMTCTQCARTAEFDDIVDRYLAFATRR
ncbi:MAG: STAS domain-containing protein [Myxococcales bacterium]|nr:STAS domain-containing protein [Myxococcales bacterium]